MAKLSGDRARYLGARACCAALGLAALAAAPRAAAGPVELVGTWHLLVHYKDAQSNNPELERWLDRVWVFEADGSRLRWTEYPIVVFDQEEGRFERRETGQYARTLQFWEPSSEQRANIRRGLQVNDRGARSRTLRGSPAEGWSSGSRPRPGSASVITYTELWSIEGPADRPVFTRQEVLGSGRSDALEGITRFATREVSGGGQRLSGSYERDGRQRGSFRLRRAGATRELEGSGKTQGQRLMQALLGDWAEAIQGGPEALRQELERRPAAGELSDAERARLGEEIRRSLEAGVERQGGDPAELDYDLDRITREIQEQVEQGRSMEEIGQMLQDGEIGRVGREP